MAEVSDGFFYDTSEDRIRDSIFDSSISQRIMFPQTPNIKLYELKKDIILTSFDERKKEFEELIPKQVPSENFESMERLKCIKIRIYPTAFQKTYFKICERTHNRFYNSSIEYINGKISEKGKIGSRSDLREALSHLFQTDAVFYDTKELAILDSLTMYKSAKANMKGKTFVLHPKPNSSQRGYFNIADKAIKVVNRSDRKITISIFQKSLRGESNIVLDDLRIKEIDRFRTCRISRNGSKYFFCVPLTVKVDTFNSDKRVISLDPGEKTPFTGFDGEYMYEFGKNTRNKILNKFSQIDSLNKNIFCSENKVESRKYKNAKRKLIRINEKIKGCIDNFHKQTSNFLTTEFDTIILPIFKSKKIIEGDLNKRSKRVIQAFSHYRFREILRQQCLRRGKRLIIVDEHWTSRTCGFCGEINTIGGKREFECERCKTLCNRDLNAARNIYMRFVKFHSQVLK